MNTQKTQQFRQGDVFLVGPVARPDGLVKLPAKGRAAIALGEVTGHSHSFAKATLLAPTKTAPECTHVEIAEALASLDHQEHASIAIPKGVYQVVRQREYHPSEIRRVTD